jgi:hypothetical protein
MPFAAFVQVAALVRFADLHFGLHTSCIPPMVKTLV